MFFNCENIINLNFENFDTRNVTNMSSMFYGCKNLKNIDLSSFNTKNVNDMIFMFNNYENLINLTYQILIQKLLLICQVCFKDVKI